MVNEEMDSLAIEYRQRLDNVIDEIADVDRRLERLYDALETGKIQLADLAPRIQQLRQRREQLQAARSQLEQELSARRVELADEETVAHCVSDLRNLLRRVPLPRENPLSGALSKKLR
jgi:chromosome segregation ATPase